MKEFETNTYGNIDIRNGLPKGSTHIPKKEYKPIRINNVCGNLGVAYAKAVVGFEPSGKSCRPIFDGIVVSSAHYQKVVDEAERWKANLIRKCKFDAGFMSKEEALPYAVEAIINLNAYLKKPRCTDAESRKIKDLKRQFALFLYKRGYCTDVGVYRPRNIMTAMSPSWPNSDRIAFSFEINDKTYCWDLSRQEIAKQVEINDKTPRRMPEEPAQLSANKSRKINVKKAKALIKWAMEDKKDESEAK